jgi:hypothetical protein
VWNKDLYANFVGTPAFVKKAFFLPGGVLRKNRFFSSSQKKDCCDANNAKKEGVGVCAHT